MRVETKKIAEINRAPYNPRIELKPGDEEYEAIKYSIETYGLVQPIVWNERTNNVVSGHQRLTVLEDIGETEVQVIVVNLDDIEEKQLNIALNRVRGRWDNDKLTEILAELGEDAKYTGFTDEELETMKKATSYFDEHSQDDSEVQENEHDGDTFTVAISFSAEDGELVENYIAVNGDSELIEAIVRTAKGE